MSKELIPMITVVPLFIAFVMSLIIRPKLVLSIQKKLYKKILGIDMNYTVRTENIMRIIGILITLISIFILVSEL